MSDLRIPFEEAIGEDLLLKPRMGQLSLAQGVALKIFYGVPLSATQRDPVTGLSELDYWTFFQGGGLLDELGYPLAPPNVAIPYVPQEYREAWMVVGRRGSKTDTFAATIVAYEAALGGHEEYVRRAQPAIVFLISQDLRAARYALNFVRGVLESSPLLNRAIKQVTADRIDLKNNITIASIPATLKASRGFASPVAVLDEVGVWYQESESANPDTEIYRALVPGQLQFPNRKIVGISTPWNKAGLLYKFYEAGTGGSKLPDTAQNRAEFRSILVLHGSTALMGNPFVTRDELAADRARDLKAFEREYLAIFQDSISGFLPASLVEAARDTGIRERPRDQDITYIAAIDPAFKRDAFGFTICHRGFDGRLVQDVVRRFMAPPGESLNPRAVLQAIQPICQSYGITVVHSDQYQAESLTELARDLGLILQGIPWTGKNKATNFINMQQMFAQGKIRILDDPETLKELKSLERTLTADTLKIAAPSGMNDDMACVLCMAANEAQFFGPRKEEKTRTIEFDDQTPYERITAQLAAKRPEQANWD
jgi:hypothetical protein